MSSSVKKWFVNQQLLALKSNEVPENLFSAIMHAVISLRDLLRLHGIPIKSNDESEERTALLDFLHNGRYFSLELHLDFSCSIYIAKQVCGKPIFMDDVDLINLNNVLIPFLK